MPRDIAALIGQLNANSDYQFLPRSVKDYIIENYLVLSDYLENNDIVRISNKGTKVLDVLFFRKINRAPNYYQYLRDALSLKKEEIVRIAATGIEIFDVLFFKTLPVQTNLYHYLSYNYNLEHEDIAKIAESPIALKILTLLFIAPFEIGTITSLYTRAEYLGWRKDGIINCALNNRFDLLTQPPTLAVAATAAEPTPPPVAPPVSATLATTGLFANVASESERECARILADLSELTTNCNNNILLPVGVLAIRIESLVNSGVEESVKNQLFYGLTQLENAMVDLRSRRPELHLDHLISNIRDLKYIINQAGPTAMAADF